MRTNAASPGRLRMRVSRCAVFSLVLIASPAATETSPESAAPAPPKVSVDATPSLTPPATGPSPSQSMPANGQTHPAQNCPGPSRIRPSLPQNKLLVSVSVTADGKMHQPVLIQSSGDGDLDETILGCVEGHRYLPTIVAGRPAAATWVMGYYWRPQPADFAPAGPSGAAVEACTNHSFPRAPVEHPPKSPTRLTYHIATDGTVTDIVVTQSSGISYLDQATVNCVSSWRFFPVYENGRAVVIDKTLSVQWQEH